MSWIKDAPLGRFALALLLVTGAASAGANVLVVRSAGPSSAAYPPGKSLPDDGVILLRQGDMLLLLGANGTRTFRGPGRFNPSAAPTLASSAVQATSRVRAGVVRSAGFVPGNNADIWQVDVNQSATHCLAENRPLLLWRADSTQPLDLTIAAADGGSRTLAWPTGEATIAWPEDLPAGAGTEYELRQPGVAVPTRIRFQRLSSQPTDIPGVAAALIEAGCREQLDLLVDSMAP